MNKFILESVASLAITENFRDFKVMCGKVECGENRMECRQNADKKIPEQDWILFREKKR